MAFMLVQGPAAGVLPSLYATELGLGLAGLGGALLVTRLIDGFIDPLIGRFSDRLGSRWGRRRPILLLGALLSAICVQFLFRPPSDATVAYYIGWSAALYVSWSLIEVSHSAWTAELSGDYDERSRAFSFRVTAAFIGVAMFSLTPLLPVFATTALTLEVMGVLATILALVLPASALAACCAAREPTDESTRPSHGWRDLWDALSKNKQFQVYAAALTVFYVGVSTPQILSFIYMDHFIGIGSQIPYVYGFSLLAAIIATPLWGRFLHRIGKKRGWMISVVGLSACCLSFFFIPKSPDSLYIVAAVDALTTVFYALGLVAAPAVLADIIDYDLWKTGVEKTGQFMAVNSLLAKATIAIGGATGFSFLSFVGYSVTEAANPPSAVLGFKIALAIVPGLFFALTLVFISRLRIDRTAQRAIRSRIERRRSTPSAAACATPAPDPRLPTYRPVL